MIIDGSQGPHAAIGHVRPVLACDLVVFLGHPSRIGRELMECGVEPFCKNAIDVVAVALDGLFAAVLPHQMSLEITLPGLSESDGRDCPANCHRRSKMRSVGLLVVLRVPSAANLNQVLLGGGARSSGRHFTSIANGNPNG
jgi:hypothetical protein